MGECWLQADVRVNRVHVRVHVSMGLGSTVTCHRVCNMAHLNSLPPSVFTLTQTPQLEALYTIIRDKETSRGDFLFYSDRIIRLLVEEGLNHLPVVSRTVETPTVSRLLKALSQSWNTKRTSMQRVDQR